MTGEGSFDAVLRNDIHLSVLKAALNLEEEVKVFGMISVVGTGPFVRLHGKINATVCKEILKKYVVPNLRTAINQPAVFMQNNALCHPTKSVETFSSEDVTVME